MNHLITRRSRLGALVLASATLTTVGCYEHTVPVVPVVIEDCGWDGSPAPEGQTLALGGTHTCALSKNGSVRCWGDFVDCHPCWTEDGPEYYSSRGILGYGSKVAIGDNEMPASAGDVDVGGPVKQITAGGSHTCALLENGAVRCWGHSFPGVLGYGNNEDIGDDETPASAGDVDVGGPVRQIAAGVDHTCALLENGAVRCWGSGPPALLGYGNTESIGDDETPASAGDVDIGGPVKQIAAGDFHTCALLENGGVRCWGWNGIDWHIYPTGDFETGYGVLGYGFDTGDIGDDETPASAGDVDVGGPVKQIAAGYGHTCVLLENGAVRCWGNNYYRATPITPERWVEMRGVLGYHPEERVIGDDETPASAGDVDVGGPVEYLSAGYRATCAVLESGAVRCWGLGIYGPLGYGNTRNVGDDETPARAGNVPLGCSAWQVETRSSHTCALLRNGAIRCWGTGKQGQLGYGNLENIGDDETPESAGDVHVW